MYFKSAPHRHLQTQWRQCVLHKFQTLPRRAKSSEYSMQFKPYSCRTKHIHMHWYPNNHKCKQYHERFCSIVCWTLRFPNCNLLKYVVLPYSMDVVSTLSCWYLLTSKVSNRSNTRLWSWPGEIIVQEYILNIHSFMVRVWSYEWYNVAMICWNWPGLQVNC